MKIKGSFLSYISVEKKLRKEQVRKTSTSRKGASAYSENVMNQITNQGVESSGYQMA